MTVFPYKTFKVLTCTVLSGLLGLDYVTGFNDLVRKKIEVKVEEKCYKMNFLRLLRQLSAQINGYIQLHNLILVDYLRLYKLITYMTEMVF